MRRDISDPYADLNGITIIGTVECPLNIPIGIGLDDTSDDSIHPSDANKRTKKGHEPMEVVLRFLRKGACSVLAMIPDVEGSREDDSQGAESKRTRKTKDVVENRDATCNKERNDAQAASACDPSSPVDQAVPLEMLRIA